MDTVAGFAANAGDILYMKLVDGEVVDVEEEERDDVLQHIGRYL